MGNNHAPATAIVAAERIRDLERQLEESEETLQAIRSGSIDALVVSGDGKGHRVFTLSSGDHPYQMLVQQMQEGAVTLMDDGTILYCNLSVATLLGVRHEQLIGQKLQLFVLPGQEDVFSQLVSQAKNAGVRSDLSLCKATGEVILIHFSLSRLCRNGEETLLCGVLTDLTEQKLRLSELAEANTRLLKEVAARKLAEKKLLLTNRTLEGKVRLRTSELVGANAKLVIAAEARERVEDALRQASKMEAIGQLTGGLAHDFNNLLAIITGTLEMLSLRAGQGRTGDLERYIKTAMASTDRAVALTQRLLAFARRQTLEPKPTYLDSLIGDMVELFRRTVGPAIHLETKLSDPSWVPLCDSNQLENVLLNLVINARDAMPDGGRIVIETVNVVFPERRDGLTDASSIDLPPGDYVGLLVTDTGTGMTPEVLKRAFDPFYTTKPLGQGTGLGLSMIHGFAQQSGGQARLRSKEGQGTTVALYLPRYLSLPIHLNGIVEPKAALVMPAVPASAVVEVMKDGLQVRMIG